MGHRRAALMMLSLLLLCSPALALAQGGLTPSGEITPYCVPTPIPTDPGPRASQGQVYTQDGSIVEVIYWRQPCAEDDGQLIVTFVPVRGAPFICGGGRNSIIQNGHQTSDFRYVRDVDGRATQVLCGLLHARTSVLVDVYDPAFAFDDDAAITFRTVWGPEATPNIANITVQAYANGPASPYIFPHGHFSGSYYDPARPGEGVLLEISEIGERRILLVSWYTYDNGQPLWILGNVDFEASDRVITVPLNTYAGAGFGTEFRPGDVVATAWGEVRVSFPTCQHVNLDWTRLEDGTSGNYAYTRLAERLLGTACRQGAPGAAVE